jgi:hypothetical protein
MTIRIACLMEIGIKQVQQVDPMTKILISKLIPFKLILLMV